MCAQLNELIISVAHGADTKKIITLPSNIRIYRIGFQRALAVNPSRLLKSLFFNGKEFQKPAEVPDSLYNNLKTRYTYVCNNPGDKVYNLLLSYAPDPTWILGIYHKFKGVVPPTIADEFLPVLSFTDDMVKTGTMSVGLLGLRNELYENAIRAGAFENFVSYQGVERQNGFFNALLSKISSHYKMDLETILNILGSNPSVFYDVVLWSCRTPLSNKFKNGDVSAGLSMVRLHAHEYFSNKGFMYSHTIARCQEFSGPEISAIGDFLSSNDCFGIPIRSLCESNRDNVTVGLFSKGNDIVSVLEVLTVQKTPTCTFHIIFNVCTSTLHRNQRLVAYGLNLLIQDFLKTVDVSHVHFFFLFPDPKEIKSLVPFYHKMGFQSCFEYRGVNPDEQEQLSYAFTNLIYPKAPTVFWMVQRFSFQTKKFKISTILE